MAWGGTYSYRVLLGLDRLGAAVLFNRDDITISSLCGLVELSDRGSSPAFRLVLSFGLHSIQLWALRRLAQILNRIQANHCQLAIQGDMATARSIIGMLNAFDQVSQP